MEAWLSHLNPILLALIRVVLWVIPVLLLLVPLIWLERRLLGWFQDRLGPNRVGPFGLLQPIADISKLFFKEEVIPTSVDRFLYSIAPGVSLLPALMMGAVIPWGPPDGAYKYLTPVADVNIGILFVMAMSSLGVYGLVLAGYSSNNKYSLMGGLRASAQLISYELAMGMSLACIVMSTGSLKVTDIVMEQTKPLWGVPQLGFFQNWNAFTPTGFVAMAVFLVCMLAETNRPPFDLPEAENELIAGYHIEYSSTKFVSFLMGEYAGMVVFGTVLSSVFLGGYNLLPFNWEVLAAQTPGLSTFFNTLGWANSHLGPLWLVLKMVLVVAGYIWIRGTLPRLRYDQLMSLGWKALLPIATFNLMLVALWIAATGAFGAATGWGVSLGALAAGIILYLNIISRERHVGVNLETRTVRMVDYKPEPPRTLEMKEGSEAAPAGTV